MTQSTSEKIPAEVTIRQTVSVIRSIASNGLLFLVLGIYLAIQTGGAWQAYQFIVLSAQVVLINFACVALIRRGRLTLGAWIFFTSDLIAPIWASLLVSKLGYVAVAYILVTTYFMIRYAMPKESQRAAWVLTAFGLIISFAAELVSPTWRLMSPLMLIVSPILTGLLGTVFFATIARQAWAGNLRNKLLVAFIGVTVLATGALSAFIIVTTNNNLQNNLEREMSTLATDRATRVGDLFNEQINILTALTLNEVLQQAVDKANQEYAGQDAAAIQASIDAKDAQWKAADAASNNADPLVREHMTNDVALDLIEFQASFHDNAEIFITDIHGGLAGTTNRTSDYNQADEEWWQAAYNDGQGSIYISDPVQDTSTGVIGVQIALPLRSRTTGKIIGILRTTYNVSAFNTILAREANTTREADLYIPGKAAHIHEGVFGQVDPGVFEQLQAVADQGMAEMDYEGTLSVVTQTPVQTLEGNPYVDQLGWFVVYHQDREEAFALVNVQIRGIIIVIVIVIFLAVVAAFVIAQTLVRPLTQLTNAAQEIAAGNLNSQARVTSSDEIGILAGTFNSMTSQLRDLIGSLEARVTARTKDLATVAEVGTATATILETDKLLQAVVDLTKERFNLYHSHIYLLDEKGENLVLASGAGEAGRQMVSEGRSIPLNREQSLVARAARERKGVTVNDVTQAPDFLPNPLLPDTRSELAVPMIVGGKVIGVFDIQSDVAGRFTESDVNIQTTLASQVSTSIQNVRSFEQSKSQAELESFVNAIGQKIQRATTVEDTLQTAIREIGLALGASRVSANIQAKRQHDGDTASRN